MPIIDLCVGRSIDRDSFLEVPIANFSQSWIVNTHVFFYSNIFFIYIISTSVSCYICDLSCQAYRDFTLLYM